MVAELAAIAKADKADNLYYGEAELAQFLQGIAVLEQRGETTSQRYAGLLAAAGLKLVDQRRISEGIASLRKAYDLHAGRPDSAGTLGELTFALGVASLRLGETENCCASHTPSSCIVPMQPEAIHTSREGSEAAAKYFLQTIETRVIPEATKLKATWLMNLAYMTLGEYPDKVPERYRVPPSVFESKTAFPRFVNVSTQLGVDSNSMAGGVAVDDFDGDDDLDIVVSCWDMEVSMRYFENLGADGFRERSEAAGFKGITGGLNIVQADYDNDGDIDLYMLRGAWLWSMGMRPNSLLQNQGDGTFRDVTFDAGMGGANYPSQTAAWADYDNDGDVDLFVGNEHDEGSTDVSTWSNSGEKVEAPSQLFRNNGDGTFTDVAEEAGVTNRRFAKGCAWGDIDNDRWPDLIVSNFSGPNRLYRNMKDGTFVDFARKAGIEEPLASFPVWVWDFDNDGTLDIFISSYRGSTDSFMLAAMGRRYPMPSGHYRGNGDGTFVNLAEAQGLDGPMLTMGANFGDINNDGYLDFYIGTGQPDISILVPNQVFLNDRGQRFHDVTMAAGLGHLQKGHAISFADIDEDGDVDIFEQMGGARRVDEYRDALFANPGTDGHWLKVRLSGVVTNRSAFGARIKATFSENGVPRSVYRCVGSGASFGASPLRQHVGMGAAETVDRLEITWPTSGETQVFENVAAGQSIVITEGSNAIRVVETKPFPFTENTAGSNGLR